jgi:hypothetical protein
MVLVDAAIYGRHETPGILSVLANTPQLRRLDPRLERNVQEWGVSFAESAWHEPEKINPEIWAGYLEPLKADNWDIASSELQTFDAIGALPIPTGANPCPDARARRGRG